MPESGDIVSQLRGRLDLLIVLLYCAFMGFGFGMVMYKMDSNHDKLTARYEEQSKELNKLRRDILILDTYRSEKDADGR
jgi:hypothetical protein